MIDIVAIIILMAWYDIKVINGQPEILRNQKMVE